MVEQSPTIQNLGKALSVAQAQMLGAKKDSTNPHFRSKYADLESVWQGCRDALTSNGLSVVQMPAFEDGICVLYTQLIHSSGEWIRSRSAAPIVKQDPQAVGSAITYLRRYALAAVAGVCPEDDDGNAASQNPPAKERKVATPEEQKDEVLRRIAATLRRHKLAGACDERDAALWHAFETKDIKKLQTLDIQALRDGLSVLDAMLTQKTHPGDDSVPFGEDELRDQLREEWAK